jgi:hypothetical protein
MLNIEREREIVTTPRRALTPHKTVMWKQSNGQQKRLKQNGRCDVKGCIQKQRDRDALQQGEQRKPK